MRSYFFAILFFYLSFVPSVVFAEGEEHIDDFLDDILESDLQQDSSSTEEPVSQKQEPTQDVKQETQAAKDSSSTSNQQSAVTETDTEQTADIAPVDDIEDDECFYSNSCEKTNAIFDANIIADDNQSQQEEENVVVEYSNIDDFYKRTEVGDGFFVYSLDETNSIILQNINIVSSPVSKEDVIEIKNVNNDTTPQDIPSEVTTTDLPDNVEEKSAPAKEDSPPVVKDTSITNRARGR